jgi:acid phosphatase type 7
MSPPAGLLRRGRGRVPVLAVALVAIVAYLLAHNNATVQGWLDNTPSARRSAGAGGGDPVVVAVGDIACSVADHTEGGPTSTRRCAETLTSDLALSLHPTAVLPLGDNEYECGRAVDFAGAYAPSWGRLLRISHPVLGNHEYGRICHANEASPYFDYFGTRAGPRHEGWYSYDVKDWHMIALNSECGYGKGETAVGGCGPDSPQFHWLESDLAAHRNTCTLAYWHEPRFSSGQHGDAQSMTHLWNTLVAAHVDVVLNGHNHDYERFVPLGATTVEGADKASTTTGQPSFQDPVPDPKGIQEFVVGTGGKNHYAFGHAPLKGEVVRNADTFGVLALTLHPHGYDWRFAPIDRGGFTDDGSAKCR